MNAELISIATDTVPLDGLFYQPPTSARGAVMLMHGNTMNFYVGAPRFLPPELVARGFACLAYNRRGHDVLSTFASRELVGGAYQTIAEAVDDNNLAAQWLAGRELDAPIVIGHSHGGMLAAHYAAHHPDAPVVVLLSAHRGGPELMRGGSDNFAKGEYEKYLRIAVDKVARGEGRELLHLPGWYHEMSAATYLDACQSMPSLMDQAKRITCPVLFIRGDAEDADNYPAEKFAEECAGPCEVEIIPDCDHFYGGHEAALATMIADFIDRHIPA